MEFTGPAVIHIADETAQVRVAAFAWQTASGLAWLEPDYLEPDPAPRPAFHEYRGVVHPADFGAAVYGPTGLLAVYDAAHARGDTLLVPDNAQRALDRFAELLQLAGTTWEAERLRVQDLLAVELGRVEG